MKFKLIIAMVADDKTELVCKVAREHGATGSTVVTSARGEGLTPAKTFLGLTLEGQVDVALFLVEQHRSREILEAINREGGFDEHPGTGIAFQVDIEDAVGLASQLKTIEAEIEDEI
jgi:hypothetical protein